MEYLSDYLWERGDADEVNPVSVTLQQVRAGRHVFLLACVCDGKRADEQGAEASGYLTSQLVEWFHGELLEEMCGKKCLKGNWQASLFHTIGRIQGELADYKRYRAFVEQEAFWGIVLVDDEFGMFEQGDCHGYLLNRRFRREHIRRLCGEGQDAVRTLQGSVQHGIGILMCSAEYDNALTAEELALALHIHTERRQSGRMGRRLRELWSLSLERGVRGSAGAVCIGL